MFLTVIINQRHQHTHMFILEREKTTRIKFQSQLYINNNGR